MTKKEFRELSIGKDFYVGCVKLKVVESKGTGDCKHCFFKDKGLRCIRLIDSGIIPVCNMLHRKDNKDVVFREVKIKSEQFKNLPVGETFVFEGKILKVKESDPNSHVCRGCFFLRRAC